jgi:hypothetical protein
MYTGRLSFVSLALVVLCLSASAVKAEQPQARGKAAGQK